MEYDDGFSGSSWNMAVAPEVPHRTWWLLQRFFMEHSGGFSGFSWNMVVTLVVPHGT
jgi:hypothetical protein